MFKGSKFSNGSFTVIRKSGHVNGFAGEDPLAKLNGYADADREIKANGFDLNGSIGGSPSGSVYGSTTGSHDASYNGSGCPTDDEEDYDDDGGDAFEEMIDALSEIETKTMTSSKPPPSAATSKMTKQEDAR